MEDGVHPQNIIKSFREAARLAIDKVTSRGAIEGADAADPPSWPRSARRRAQQQLVGGEKEFFAKMCVDAVMSLDQDLLDPRMIGVKKVMGGSMRDSFLVAASRSRRPSPTPGSNSSPSTTTAKVLDGGLELERQSRRDTALERLSDPGKYQEIVDAEWNIIYDLPPNSSRAARRSCSAPRHRRPRRSIAATVRVLRRSRGGGRAIRGTKATGARVQTTVNDVTPEQLGTCAGRQRERWVGNERFRPIGGGRCRKTCTMVLRIGAGSSCENSGSSLATPRPPMCGAVKAAVGPAARHDMDAASAAPARTRARHRGQGSAVHQRLRQGAGDYPPAAVRQLRIRRDGRRPSQAEAEARARSRRLGRLRPGRQRRGVASTSTSVHLGALAGEDQRHRRGVRGDVPGALDADETVRNPRSEGAVAARPSTRRGAGRGARSRRGRGGLRACAAEADLKTNSFANALPARGFSNGCERRARERSRARCILSPLATSTKVANKNVPEKGLFSHKARHDAARASSRSAAASLGRRVPAGARLGHRDARFWVARPSVDSFPTANPGEAGRSGVSIDRRRGRSRSSPTKTTRFRPGGRVASAARLCRADASDGGRGRRTRLAAAGVEWSAAQVTEEVEKGCARSWRCPPETTSRRRGALTRTRRRKDAATSSCSQLHAADARVDADPLEAVGFHRRVGRRRRGSPNPRGGDLSLDAAPGRRRAAVRRVRAALPPSAPPPRRALECRARKRGGAPPVRRARVYGNRRAKAVLRRRRGRRAPDPRRARGERARTDAPARRALPRGARAPAPPPRRSRGAPSCTRRITRAPGRRLCATEAKRDGRKRTTRRPGSACGTGYASEWAPCRDRIARAPLGVRTVSLRR